MAACALACLAGTAQAQADQASQAGSVTVPALWPLDQRLQRPDVSRLRSIRFLTESDYPPFNYIDETGRLVGFNIDLATAICDALKVECSIKTRTFEKLFQELENGGGDAIIASVAMTAANRERVDFSDRYYLTPARFASRTDSQLTGVRPGDLEGKTVGVVEGTAHEAFLKAYFASAKITPFKTRKEARAALKDGSVDILFDDGISLAFWLHGREAEDCCAFRGGPFLESRYFGEGVGIAVRKGNDSLRKILNYALREVFMKGKYEEIFLRHFPLSFY